MILMIIFLVYFVTGLQAEAWDNMNEHEDFIAGKAPFFELACMRVGGTCAKSNSCPPGTKVAQMGLCPEQQRFGMECCRPLKTWEIENIKEPAGLDEIDISKPDEDMERDAMRIRKKLMNHLIENPLKGVTECRSRHGQCVPKSTKCSQNLRILDSSGCGLNETCCTRIELTV